MLRSRKVQAEGETPVWEPPHYRRPWDSLPIGVPPFYGSSALTQEGYDPRFDAVYGYGTERLVPRATYNPVVKAPTAPRYPFDYLAGAPIPYPGAPGMPFMPLGYDPVLSSMHAEQQAAKAEAAKKA